MKGKSRRAIVSLISAVILLVSVTYAWILDSGYTNVRFIKVDFTGREKDSGRLDIVSAEVSVELVYQDGSGNYVVKANDDTPLVFTGLLPNDMFPFKIRFYNQTGESQNVSLTIDGITTDTPELLQQLYVGTTGGTGYADATDANVVKPANQFLCLSEAQERSNGVFDMKLYPSLIIPPTAAGGYVEVNCFFWLNRDATIELAGKTLSITSFRILV